MIMTIMIFSKMESGGDDMLYLHLDRYAHKLCSKV